jgi:predicted lipid-binding transport protein (Tim44 family)
MKQSLRFLQSPSKVIASIFTAVMAVALLVAVPDADAKRMGGGRSVGKSSQTTQKDAAPANNAASNTTSPAAAPAAAAKAPAAAPAPASNRSKWLGPLAGLAAGLGLAALASHFGFGEGLANIMMIALFAMVAFAAFRFFMARRAANAGGARSATPAFAGAYAGSAGSAGNVGSAGVNANNHATAYQALPPQSASSAGYSGASGAYTGGIGSALADGGLQSIAGFDDAAFVRQAKVYFVRLQAAYDSADQKDLREFTSPEMFAELMMEIRERNGATNRTEVERLDAELLGQGQDGTHQHVSVRFHGQVKEFEGSNTHADAQPINETWNFAKPLDGSEGWTLVGIEQNA